ncbi:MAG: hypothetical protein ACYDCC_12780 [Actinomycetota bacterium]
MRHRVVRVLGGLICAVSLLMSLPAAAAPSPTSSPSSSPKASPKSSASPSPSASSSATPKPLVAVKPGRSTDTEYIKVRIDRSGKPEAAWLKDWIRLRGSGNRALDVPGHFASVRYLAGTPGATPSQQGLHWNVGIGTQGFRDLYYEGRMQQAGDEFVTPQGPKPLPVSVSIKYYTGDEGSEQEVTPLDLEHTDQPTRFKIVITLTNTTKTFEEVPYTDIQTKQQVIATAPVFTPYVARIADLRFPDGSFDQIRTDGDLTRDGSATVLNWTKYLIPPDFAEQQNAIVTGIIARGVKLPQIHIVAQPVYPPFDSSALNGTDSQFQRGRRNFFYDVFGLFRDNLIALTGLFGLLHDSFANLSIPLLGPEKGNRENGSFAKPNQLWALWTLAKGMEQIRRVVQVFDSTSQLLRAAVKGSLATIVQLRAFIGYSTDKSIVTGFPPASITDALLGSIWSDLKTLATLCGDTGFSTQTTPYFPTNPLITCSANPQMALQLNLVFLKLALVEHDLQSVQKENHTLNTALLAGLSNLPAASGSVRCNANDPKDNAAGQTCGSYSKYIFIKFPFGLEEIERALYTLQTQGFEPLLQAIGSKDMPNTLINALNALTQGTEAQIDAFHQLGATWRYIADSIQNFAIFGVDSARSFLQWDVSAIDIKTAVRAAEVARATQMSTFMGVPKDPDGQPALGQVVISFSTDATAEIPHATDTGAGKAATSMAAAFILAVLAGFGRFKWHVI